MSRTLRLTLITAGVAVTALTLAGTAVADDARQTCVDTVVCTGHVIDIHDITLDDAIVRLLSP